MFRLHGNYLVGDTVRYPTLIILTLGEVVILGVPFEMPLL